MLAYIIRRILLSIPVLIGVSLITFFLTQVGGDPVRIMMGQHADKDVIAQIRHELHLDEPLWKQYLYFLHDFFTGKLRSFKTKRPVWDHLKERFPYTLSLAILSIIIATIIGVSAGIISAVKRGSWFDNLAMLASMIGISTPVYLIGLVFILLFIKKLGWIHGVGVWDAWLEVDLGSIVVQIWFPLCILLPAITLGAQPAAFIARITRSSMLEVVKQDYIRTARAKGVPEREVVLKHALRNALIPVITVLGLEFAYLLGGAVLTETVYAWPGLGTMAVQAFRDRDIPMIQGTVLFIAFTFVFMNLIVDVLYSWIDPRIRYD